MIINTKNNGSTVIEIEDAKLFLKPMKGRRALQMLDAQKNGAEAFAEFIFGMIERQEGIEDESGKPIPHRKLLDLADDSFIASVIEKFSMEVERINTEAAKKNV
jgi:hypothetical protein